MPQPVSSAPVPPPAPSLLAKAALVTGRIAHKPFEVPTDFTKGALVTGGVAHTLVGATNKTLIDAVEALSPRGPAKLITPLLSRIDGSVVSSADQAKKATELFWIPFSEGSHRVGHAVSNPFSQYYAAKVGFEMPAAPADHAKALEALTHAGGFPVPPPPPPKTPDGPPPPDAPKGPDGAPAPDAPKAPDDGPAPDAPKAPDGPPAPDAPKAPDDGPAPDAPKAPDGAPAPDAPKAPDVPNPTEAPENVPGPNPNVGTETPTA